LLQELAAGGAIVRVTTPIAGNMAERWALPEDARLIQLAFDGVSPTQDRDQARLGLLKRLLAAGGPMTLDQIAARYAFPLKWLQNALDDLLQKREVVYGRISPGSGEMEWCDRRNLERIVHQNLVILRREIEPVPATVLARALLQRQGTQSSAWKSDPAFGSHDMNLLPMFQLLRGISAPYWVWNWFILPARCESYRLGDLDSQIAGGETIWALDPSHDPHQQWIRFFSSGEGRLFLPDSLPTEKLSEEARLTLNVLLAEGALFQSELRAATGLNPDRLNQALSELLYCGAVTNDQLGALASLPPYACPNADSSDIGTGSGRSQPPAAPFGKADHELARLRAELPGKPPDYRPSGAGRPASLGRRPSPDRLREAKRRVADRLQSRTAPTAFRYAAPEIRGRWSTLYRPSVLGPELQPNEAANRQIKVLLDRYGLINRLWLEKEGRNWSWPDLEKQMERLELRGDLRRGIFAEGLRGPQYAAPEFLEQLRTMRGAPAAGIYRAIHTLDPLFPILALAALESGELGLPLTPSFYRIAYFRDERLLMIWDVPASAPGAVNCSDATSLNSPELVAALQSLLEAIGSTRSRLRIGQWNGIPARLSAGADLLAACGFVPEMDDMVWEPD
ncbi:MAG: hypothetical protein M1330_02050, partial [Armatimonadetes bacterium]|nr:hypothetical protein [Armatimonadota bacterium]